MPSIDVNIKEEVEPEGLDIKINNETKKITVV